MTVQERPAGRPACGARPAGARGGRGTGTPSTSPTIIREALAFRETHTRDETAARFGVAGCSIARWRDRAARAAAAGELWPSDADVAYWEARQPVRAVTRTARRRWVRQSILVGPRLIDGTGTRRRLQALSALGWRNPDLAVHLGVGPVRVGHLTRGLSDRVFRDTAAAVAEVYDRLSMRPGPSAVTRARALANGWAPPLAWDDDSIDDPKARPRRGVARSGGPIDEVAVQRAMAGDGDVELRPVERAVAVSRLTARRLSAAEIAERLNTTKRSVTRHRSTDTSRRSA